MPPLVSDEASHRPETHQDPPAQSRSGVPDEPRVSRPARISTSMNQGETERYLAASEIRRALGGKSGWGLGCVVMRAHYMCLDNIVKTA
jgi:hypothetical protein